MAEITLDQLTAAIDGMEIVVDIMGARVPGMWTGAKVRYPESLASAILARIESQPGQPHTCPATLALTAWGDDEETAIMARIARLDLDDPDAARRIVEWARKRLED